MSFGYALLPAKWPSNLLFLPSPFDDSINTKMCTPKIKKENKEEDCSEVRELPDSQVTAWRQKAYWG